MIDWNKPIALRNGFKARYVMPAAHRAEDDPLRTRWVLVTDAKGEEFMLTYPENGIFGFQTSNYWDLVNVPETYFVVVGVLEAETPGDRRNVWCRSTHDTKALAESEIRNLKAIPEFQNNRYQFFVHELEVP